MEKKEVEVKANINRDFSSSRLNKQVYSFEEKLARFESKKKKNQKIETNKKEQNIQNNKSIQNFQSVRKVNKMHNENRQKKVIIAIIIFFVGVAIFSYPIISSYFAEKNQTTVIQEYDEAMKKVDEEFYKKEKQKATEYNESLSGDPVHDPFVPGSGYALPKNYISVLNIGDGVMGYISIPKISLRLPIYHGSSQEILAKGVGHIESTALPIGGENRHSVLTGHRGLPNSRLFTDINLLKEGDIFYIYILNETLAYKVDQIKTIEPNELSSLVAVEGKDYITLVTCTPYGINTHRLLVRAERMDYVPEEVNITPKVTDIVKRSSYQIFGIVVGLIILTIGYCYYKHLKRKN